MLIVGGRLCNRNVAELSGRPMEQAGDGPEVVEGQRGVVERKAGWKTDDGQPGKVFN